MACPTISVSQATETKSNGITASSEVIKKLLSSAQEPQTDHANASSEVHKKPVDTGVQPIHPVRKHIRVLNAPSIERQDKILETLASLNGNLHKENESVNSRMPTNGYAIASSPATMIMTKSLAMSSWIKSRYAHTVAVTPTIYATICVLVPNKCPTWSDFVHSLLDYRKNLYTITMAGTMYHLREYHANIKIPGMEGENQEKRMTLQCRTWDDNDSIGVIKSLKSYADFEEACKCNKLPFILMMSELPKLWKCIYLLK
jgi:hypothetical protein